MCQHYPVPSKLYCRICFSVWQQCWELKEMIYLWLIKRSSQKSTVLSLSDGATNKSPDSWLLEHPSWTGRRLHVARLYLCMCVSLCTKCNKSPWALVAERWSLRAGEAPGVSCSRTMWRSKSSSLTAEDWLPMAGSPKEAHTCSRWLQVDMPASNWTINTTLRLLMAAVCLSDATLPFGRRQESSPHGLHDDTLQEHSKQTDR